MCFGRKPTNDFFQKLAECNIDVDDLEDVDDAVATLAARVRVLPSSVISEEDKDMFDKFAADEPVTDDEVSFRMPLLLYIPANCY